MISGKRLNPFFGNAAADYTRVLNYGNEIEDYNLFSRMNRENLLGFVTTKTLTSEPREGNPKPRIWWKTPSNYRFPPFCDDDFKIEYEQGIQSMGLPNVGIYNFPFEKCEVPTVVSFVGKNKDETKAMTKYVSDKAKKNQNIFQVEYNGACPNVSGCPSCYKENILEHLKIVRENIDIPIFAKIGYFPEEDRLINFGRKIEDIGINGVTAINSPPGMEINANTRKTVTAMKYGGIFGTGLKPLALRTVNILHDNTDMEIIGLGGVYKPSDAIEFLLAGANAVEIGSKFVSAVNSNYFDLTMLSNEELGGYWRGFLMAFKKGINEYMEEKKIESLEEIIGKLD